MDTSDHYWRDMLRPIPASLASATPPLLSSLLRAPLGSKLPVRQGVRPAVDAALLTTSGLLEYVVIAKPGEAAASAAELCNLVENVVCPTGLFDQCDCKARTMYKMMCLVDVVLGNTRWRLGLSLHWDRGAVVPSDARAERLRPDFLCWVHDVLLFKGEERASDWELQDAILALSTKMTNTWAPALLPGASMPFMLAYAAAGDLVQFFAVYSRDGAVVVDAISERLMLSTALGRVKALHFACNILRLLAAYAPSQPVPIALGSSLTMWSDFGDPLRSILFLDDCVAKYVFNFERQHRGFNDLSMLQELYAKLESARCDHLPRLATPGGLAMRGTTLALRLAPLGEPQSVPPYNEAELKRAVRHVLSGLAVLHDAGFVHRDVRWANVIRVPGGADGAPERFVLMDLEHAARAASEVDCRLPPYPLAHWPPDAVQPPDGRFTPASDLVLVARCLMSGLPFLLSEQACVLWRALVERRLSAREALAHAWFAADG